MFGAGGVTVAVGLLDPAVVADVDDEGIFGEPLSIEPFEQLAAGFIEPLDHREVAGDGVGGDALGFVFREQAFGRGVRRVREERRIPDEERFLLGGGVIDEIKNWFQALAPDGETVVAVATAGLRKAAGHAVGEAGALIAALPPFAGLVAEVAAGGEELGEVGRVVEV